MILEEGLLRLRRALRPVHLLALIALVVRLVRLGAQGFWFDESYTHFIARMPLDEGMRAMIVDGVHPPLFNWIEKAALLLGGTEAAFRIPSVIFGVLGVVLLYALAERWFGARVAFVAGLLLALSPYHLWYSQEARSYAMLAAMSVASMLAYTRMLDDDHGWRKAVFVAVSALTYLTHYFALMLPLIQFTHLMINLRTRWRQLRIWTLLQVVASVPILLWVVALAQQEGRVFGIGWIPASHWQDLLYTIINFSVGYALPLTLFHWLALAVFMSLMLSAAASTALDRDRRSLLYLWAFLPMLLTFLLSFRQPTYVDRFFIGSLPAMSLLAGLGIERLAGWKAIAAKLFACALLIAGMVSFNYSPAQQKEAWADAARIIADADADEAVVVRILQIIVPLSYYYEGDHPIEAMEVNRVITPLDQLAAGRVGLWLVYWNATTDAHLVAADPPFDAAAEKDPLTAAWIRGDGPELIERFDLRGVTIFHFGLPPQD